MANQYSGSELKGNQKEAQGSFLGVEGHQFGDPMSNFSLLKLQLGTRGSRLGWSEIKVRQGCSAPFPKADQITRMEHALSCDELPLQWPQFAFVPGSLEQHGELVNCLSTLKLNVYQV